MKAPVSLLIAVVAATQLGATDCGEVIRDPGFDLWCGDSLCTWKLLRGDIERVGTWNAGDSGVSFVGADTAIQQIAPVTSLDGDCIEFTLIANVATTAEVFLDIDVEADGTVERSERIPTAHYKPISILIALATPYDGIRFELRKQGTGETVLANIGAHVVDQCTGLTPIDPGPRPVGASCAHNSDCASNLCVASPTQPGLGTLLGTACAGCDPTGTSSGCDAGEACGITGALQPTLAEGVACVAEASHELGEACLSGAECASGICNADLRCSACATGADCGGDACGPSFQGGPDVCRPGAGTGATGDACATDADCTGTCDGAVRKECRDHRACGSPADCPVENDLAPGACTTVGIQGGTCS